MVCLVAASSGPVRFGNRACSGMLAIVILDRVADRLHRATQPAGDAPADLGERAAADTRQTAGTP